MDDEDLILERIQNPVFNDFDKQIESIRARDKLPYMEAILSLCETKDIDIDVIARYINSNVVLKAKIQEEAEDLHYIERTSRLPI